MSSEKEKGMLVVPMGHRKLKYDLPRDSEGLARHYLRDAEEFLLANSKEQYAPCFLLFTEEDQLLIDGRGFMDDGETREEFSYAVRSIAKKVAAIASVFTSEMWLAMSTPEEAEEFLRSGKEIQPSTHPGRIECIMSVGEYQGMGSYIAASSMIRNSSDAIISFKPALIPTEGFEGRFCGILDGVGK
jgi:hypothetical protein